MREAEIITDLDINNIDGWYTLSLEMFSLSGVDTQHLPGFSAAVLQKNNFEAPHRSACGSFCHRKHQEVERLFLCQLAVGDSTQ